MAETLNNYILLYDTTFTSIYKTIDHLKNVFPNLHIIKSEESYFEHLHKNKYDIVICSLDVAPMDGIAITKETSLIYKENKPFFILYSKKQDDFLIELAYNSGADAFVSYQNTPLLMEMLIKALLKRIKTTQNGFAKKGVLFIDEDKYIITKDNEHFELPKKEFTIFLFLNNNPTKFLNKKEIALHVWADEAIANKRNIDVHIYNIRKIFGKNVIQSQKGKGYRINKKYFS